MTKTSHFGKACVCSSAVCAHRNVGNGNGGAHGSGVDEPRATILTEVAVVVAISNLGGVRAEGGLGHQGPPDSPVEGLPGMGGPSEEGT